MGDPNFPPKQVLNKDSLGARGVSDSGNGNGLTGWEKVLVKVLLVMGCTPDTINHVLSLIGIEIRQNSELQQQLEDPEAGETVAKSVVNDILRKRPELSPEVEKGKPEIQQNPDPAKLAKDIETQKAKDIVENFPSKAVKAFMEKMEKIKADLEKLKDTSDDTKTDAKSETDAETSVDSKPLTRSAMDKALGKLNEMVRDGNTDPRAAAQLFLLGEQLKSGKNADEIIRIASRIAADSKLVAKAVGAANRAQSQEGKDWGEAFLAAIGGASQLSGEIQRLENESRPLREEKDRFWSLCAEVRHRTGKVVDRDRFSFVIERGKLSEALDNFQGTNEERQKLEETIGKYDALGEKDGSLTETLTQNSEKIFDKLNSLDAEIRAFDAKIASLSREIRKTESLNEMFRLPSFLAKHNGLPRFSLQCCKDFEKISNNGKPEVAAFLGCESAEKVLGDQNFDAAASFKAKLISKLGGGSLGDIEEMEQKHPDEFRALSALAVMQGFIEGDEIRFSPNKDMVEERVAKAVCGKEDMNQVFAELFEEQRKVFG